MSLDKNGIWGIRSAVLAGLGDNYQVGCVKNEIFIECPACFPAVLYSKGWKSLCP
jgi:hypothetical protein